MTSSAIPRQSVVSSRLSVHRGTSLPMHTGHFPSGGLIRPTPIPFGTKPFSGILFPSQSSQTGRDDNSQDYSAKKTKTPNSQVGQLQPKVHQHADIEMQHHLDVEKPVTASSKGTPPLTKASFGTRSHVQKSEKELANPEKDQPLHPKLLWPSNATHSSSSTKPKEIHYYPTKRATVAVVEKVPREEIRELDSSQRKIDDYFKKGFIDRRPPSNRTSPIISLTEILTRNKGMFYQLTMALAEVIITAGFFSTNTMVST